MSLTAASLDFLRNYARTQRHRVGLPSAFTIIPTTNTASGASASAAGASQSSEAQLLFLRSADGEQAAQHLYSLNLAHR
jgi:hypothetical protein